MTLFILFTVHGRQREDEREKRLQYWREQVKLFSSRRRSPLLTVLPTHRTLSVGTSYSCMKRPKPPYSRLQQVFPGDRPHIV
jgi:hypothetical protein